MKKGQVIASFCCLIVVAVTMLLPVFYKESLETMASTGYFGVFVACCASTSTILLPAPGILVVLQYARFLNPVLVVILGGVGTASGELVGFLLGRVGSSIVQIDTKSKLFLCFRRYPKLVVFLFSLIPFPVFDIVGIFSGTLRMNPIEFYLSCVCGKIIKLGIYVILFKIIVV